MAEDPELERKLDAMFASARPRSGFEEELLQRIRARRPWWERLRDQFPAGQWLAPALAAVLVLAVGVGWLVNNVHPLGAASTATTAGGAAFGQKGVVPGFGVLPSLGSTGGRASGATSPQAADSSAAPKVEASAFSFTGTLPELPAELPVYRYLEPTAAQRSAAAQRLAAQSGLAVSATASDARSEVEPQFVVGGQFAQPGLSGPGEVANAFLQGHGLIPTYAYQVSVSGSGTTVVYVRQFLGPTGAIPQVRLDGGPAGTTVDVQGSAVTRVSGPLDLPLESAAYALTPASSALAGAGVQTTAGGAQLDRATLVYVVVVTASRGYYEPELMLTGPGGTVLIPVIAPGWLAH